MCRYVEMENRRSTQIPWMDGGAVTALALFANLVPHKLVNKKRPKPIRKVVGC